MNTNEILKAKIEWQPIENSSFFYCLIDNRIVYLRINNWPDEILFTLINELEILDLEESPKNWKINYNE